MSGVRPSPSQDLQAVRGRRTAYRDAMVALEAANASPAGARWRERITEALARTRSVLDAHIAETEAAHGFFATVVADEPRVAGRVDALRRDHTTMLDTVDTLRKRADDPDCSAEELREQIVDLLALLHRHRHRGADLLYEAYEVDVSAGD